MRFASLSLGNILLNANNNNNKVEERLVFREGKGIRKAITSVNANQPAATGNRLRTECELEWN